MKCRSDLRASCLFAALSFGIGCSSDSEAPPESGDAPQCEVVEAEQVPASAAHEVGCPDLAYDTDPPSGGPHYQDWAAFQTYTFPVPHGFLVHSLEHGAIVFWYNCPEGCAAEVARAQAVLDAQPVDPLCSGRGTNRRAILTPSPTLGSRWAASSWGWTLTADCFDESAFGAFYAAHYAQGPENFCSPGVVVTPALCP